jgi:glycosyltransferase involved in cell wall biosynthesis
MIHQSLEMGGAERQGLLLAQWLKETHGADIEVWGLRHVGAAAKWCDKQDIPWRHVSWTWSASKLSNVIGMFRLLIALKRARADVLLPYTMPPNIGCGIFWRLSGARTCVWNQRDDGRQRLAPYLERYAVKNTPWFISNSRHAADFLTKELGVSRERIDVIPNGIELAPMQLVRDDWRLHHGVPKDSFVACMVANLHHYKDHPTLLKAWQLVIRACAQGDSPPILLLAGHDYGHGAELRAMADQLDVTNQVRFLGHVDDVTGMLNASDIGVFSSLREGLPNGVLECMAAGLPVVATNIPGIREAVGHNDHQLLVEPRDSAAMAEAILRLMHDYGLRNSLGEKNLNRISTEFSREQMCRRTCQVITKAMGLEDNLYSLSE